MTDTDNDIDSIQPEIDVIIIGGGISGLVAAYKILKKESTLRVLILEQNNRIGGQILSNDDDELGAKWFNENQYHIVNLCSELNIRLIRKHVLSENLIRLWDIDQDLFAPLAKFELHRFLKYIDLISIKYYPGNLIKNNKSITMEKYLCNKLLFNSSRNVVRLLVRVSTGLEAHRISLNEYLTICNSTFGASNQLNWYTYFNLIFFILYKYNYIYIINLNFLYV